jgi:hypothetical protein
MRRGPGVEHCIDSMMNVMNYYLGKLSKKIRNKSDI